MKYRWWKYYYGKGIRIAPRWYSFGLFLVDMGERPTGTTLDRIEGEKNYEPGNCRWGTKKEQMENRKSFLSENIPCSTFHKKEKSDGTLQVSAGSEASPDRHREEGAHVDTSQPVPRRVRSTCADGRWSGISAGDRQQGDGIQAPEDDSTEERRLTVARKNKPRQLDRPQDERECSRPYCKNGRRKGGRYCVECHAEDMARRRREGTVAA